MEFNVSVKVNPISLIVKALSFFNRQPIKDRFTYIWSQIALLAGLIFTMWVADDMGEGVKVLISFIWLAWSMFVDYKRVVAIGASPWWILLRLIPFITIAFVGLLAFIKDRQVVETVKETVKKRSPRRKKPDDDGGFPEGETVTQ